jgi:hypothetical protein
VGSFSAPVLSKRRLLLSSLNKHKHRVGVCDSGLLLAVYFPQRKSLSLRPSQSVVTFGFGSPVIEAVGVASPSLRIGKEMFISSLDCGLFLCLWLSLAHQQLISIGIGNPNRDLEYFGVFDGGGNSTLRGCSGSGEAGRHGVWEQGESSRTTEEPRSGLTNHTRTAIRETGGRSHLRALHMTRASFLRKLELK